MDLVVCDFLSGETFQRYCGLALLYDGRTSSSRFGLLDEQSSADKKGFDRVTVEVFDAHLLEPAGL